MISKDKQYRTRDGREVRIYATDAGIGKNLIHGATHDDDFGWVPHVWLPDGKHECDSSICLVEVKPRHKRTVWLNVYEADNTECVGSAYMTARDAYKAAAVTRIACIKVDLDFEEGEGL